MSAVALAGAAAALLVVVIAGAAGLVDRAARSAVTRRRLVGPLDPGAAGRPNGWPRPSWRGAPRASSATATPHLPAGWARAAASVAVPPVVVGPRLRARLDGLALPLPAETSVGLGLTASVVVVAGTGVVAGRAMALLALVAAVAAGVSAVVLGRGRADRLVDRELPDVLDMVAAGLRSGAALPAALHEGRAAARGPVRGDLDHVLATHAVGVPFVDALTAWRSRRSTPAVRATVAALAIAATAGGGAARAVDGVAAGLRDRRAVDRELRALATQARASAVVIMTAPLGFAVLTGASDPEAWAFLTASPVGLVCTTAGLALDLAGGVWMARLTRGAT